MTHADIRVIPQEARPYQGQRAGIVSRILANVVDAAVIVGIMLAAYAGWAVVRFLRLGADFRFPTPSYTVVFWAACIVAVVYFTIAWSTSGRTYGGHLLGLRIVDARGRRLHLFRASVRAVLCVAFPFLLAWAAISSRNRSVQDVVLRTSVVYDWVQRPAGTKGTEPQEN
jgi:uncharacterized RDD family membrane protein YckC